MSFNSPINLFELSEKVVERFQEETGFKLTGYEFSWRFKRDWSFDRIYFYLSIFGEEHAYTLFGDKYNTVDKVVDLLFVHLRDDAGMVTWKDGLTRAKSYQLERRLTDLTRKIEVLAKEAIESKNWKPLIIMVDEKYPYHEFRYENGFPVFQYSIYQQDINLKLLFDLDFDLRGLDKEKILLEVKEQLNTLL